MKFWRWHGEPQTSLFPVLDSNSANISAETDLIQQISQVMIGVTRSIQSSKTIRSNLDLITVDGATPWPGYADSSASGPSAESQACSPYVIAVRGDRLLVGDTVYGWDPDHGATGGFGAIFEVAGDGTTLQPLTPVELGQSGGVLQVLTTAEAGN